MAKAIPVEHYRVVYGGYQARAALFGVDPQEFNTRVRARFRGATPYPQMWCTYAYLEIQGIAGNKCCPKAEVVPCVCEVSFRCPDHGGRCVGSHD